MIGKLLSHHRNKFWKAASEVVREVGLTLYVRGSFLSRDMAYLEPHPRHRVLNYFEGELPEPSAKANIMPTAALFGNVAVGKYTTIWYGAILRGEANIIRVGQHCEIMDHALLKTTRFRTAEAPESLTIGNRVFIGPMAIVGSVVIDDDVYIGGKAVVGDGCRIERGVVIAPNSVVPTGSYLPAHTYWAGNRAVLVGKLEAEGRRELLAGFGQKPNEA